MNPCFVVVENDRNLYSLVNSLPTIFPRCGVYSVILSGYSILFIVHDLEGYIQFTLNATIYPVMHYRNDFLIFNKTPAQAFTPPADEKKMGTNWIFVYYAVYGSGRGRCRDFLILK